MSGADLLQLENMSISKSWWDTVDGITPTMAGRIFRDNKLIRDKYIYRWMESENI